MSDSSVTALCDIVMRSVANSGVVTDANIEKAVQIICAEMKAFLMGEEYADERAAVLAGTIHERMVVSSVVASCISKIRAS